MMTGLYLVGISLYHAAIQVAAWLGVSQARRWVDGRKQQGTFHLPQHLRPRPDQRLIWMHCASLGEFEQGRPVLEQLRTARPEWKVLLTFFSPSGYERCKEDPLADHVAYLPPDGPGRASRWVAEIAPDLAVFVKYEFWFFHLRALHRAEVPTFLVAASFRPGQLFFRPWGGWWRGMLRFFTTIVVQTERDRSLLTGPGRYPSDRIVVAGDPRMDRTLQLAEAPFTDEKLATFTAANQTTIIAGSVWPADVDRWRAVFPGLPSGVRLVLAPHQLDESQLTAWQKDFSAARYTQANVATLGNYRVLLLDTIGLLSRAYRYGELAYVGGAFRTGLHNTLEPLAYGLPVIFGPKHNKFPEAGAAIRAGGAFSITTPAELTTVVHQLLHPDKRELASQAQLQLAHENAGAGKRSSQVILSRLRPGQPLSYRS